MQLSFIKCHGSGNDFPLIDARDMPLGDDEWGAVARLMADRNGPVGGDGLLLLTRGDAAHDFGMRMFNSDGSEAETCLNGVRCTARLGFELLGVAAARVKLKASSATAARAEPIAPGVVTIRTEAGASTRTADVGLRIDADTLIEQAIPGFGVPHAFTAVAMPNPHLIRFVDEVDEAALIAAGRYCESGPDLLPARGNVSAVELRDAGLFVRTFERGVGLTDSCGSAMAASVFAACLTGRRQWGAPMPVFNKGGMVRAAAHEDPARVTIEGNASFLYDASVAIDPAAGTIGVPVIHARREAEVAAWNALVAGLA